MPVRRSNSNKKIDKGKDEKMKKDKFKAKIAWNATSPRDNKIIVLN